MLKEKIKEVFKTLNAVGSKYLLFGRFATVLYGVDVGTRDLDLLIEDTDENIKITVQAIESLGYTITPVRLPDDIRDAKLTFAINDFPIDIFTAVIGSEYGFNHFWERRNVIKFNELDINTMSLEDLIYIKRLSGREKDLEEVKKLEDLIAYERRAGKT